MHVSVALCLSAVALCVAPPSPGAGRPKAEKPSSYESTSYEILDLDNYDLNLENYGEAIDLNNYDDFYEYTEQKPKVEVGTLAPLVKKAETLKTTQEPQRPTLPPVKATQAATQAATHVDPGLFGSMTEQGLPTCLVCVCLGSSTYCDDVDLKTIPPLPKNTVYLYARFNKITQVRISDFAGLKKLKHVDLSNNALTEIDNEAFHQLPSLQELILSKNQLTILPQLPSSLIKLDAQQNELQGYGFQPQEFENNNVQTIDKDTFCDSKDLAFIRGPLEDIRLDGNPIILSNFADGFSCLRRLPVGNYY
ncbi:opticin isoform 2-T3 [Discoglossus pictus]